MATIYARCKNQKQINNIYDFLQTFMRMVKKIKEMMKLKYVII